MNNKILPEEALYDYIHLREKIAIYEYIAFNDFKYLDGEETKILYWYKLAKEDEYDKYLLKLCKIYGIEVNENDLMGEDYPNVIYDIEELLLEKIKEILKKVKIFNNNIKREQ